MRKSAERSAASIVRCCRALFAADVTSMLKVKLPPYPFAGVKLRDPGPQRYHSEIDPVWLLGCAERELRQEHAQQYLGLFLCLWAGLRRKEADLLLWEQVDLQAGQIHVRRTRWFEPKTEESQRAIDLAPEAQEVTAKEKGIHACPRIGRRHSNADSGSKHLGYGSRPGEKADLATLGRARIAAQAAFGNNSSLQRPGDLGETTVDYPRREEPLKP